MPSVIVERFKQLYEASIAPHLAGDRVLHSHARLALVTKRADQLTPPQWICHRDRLFCSIGSMCCGVRDLSVPRSANGWNLFLPTQD